MAAKATAMAAAAVKITTMTVAASSGSGMVRCGDMAALAAADVVRGGGGNSSGGRQRRRRPQRERAAGAQRERMYVFFSKFISYVAFYVGPIQTGFLMAFLARFRRNRNHDFPFKTSDRNEKKPVRR